MAVQPGLFDVEERLQRIEVPDVDSAAQSVYAKW